MSPRRPTTEATPGVVTDRMEDEDTGTWRSRTRNVEHAFQCWESKDGPGHQLREEVRNGFKEVAVEIKAINKNRWLWQGGLLLASALGPIFLGFWLNSRLAKEEDNASRRDNSAVLFRNARAAEAPAFRVVP